MIWFWSRENQEMRLETRYDNDTAEFVVAIQYPDGRQESERFSDIEVLRKRLIALEQKFAAEHWTQAGAPIFVPDGFPNRRLAPELSGVGLGGHGARSTATRSYSIGVRTFDITLSSAAVTKDSSWTVASVIDTTRGGREVVIPTMDIIVASTEDAAFARACDRIDKWLMSNP